MEASVTPTGHAPQAALPPSARHATSFDQWRDLLHVVTARQGLVPPTVRPTWAEDLCVYREAAMLFGTVTHEGDAFLRLSDAEWMQWEAHAAVIRRAE